MKADAAAFGFTWTDAWVLTSLYCSHKHGSALDLPALLRTGEELNFNTFKWVELNESLTRLNNNGLIQIKENHLYYTQLGRQMISKARFRPGGWFSRVDITLKVLNSSETGTAGGQTHLRGPLITQAQYDQAYAIYIGQPAQPINYELDQDNQTT
jgi:hypothetical protein